MTDSTHVSAVPVEPDPPEEARRRRWLVAVVAAGIAVVLVAAALAGSRVLGWWGDDEPVASPEASPSPTEPVDPFAGTPAEDFAEGADGIVLPEAEPVGDFTADEVAGALEQVRAALIAARLDPTMLVDHDDEAFLDQLAAAQRPTVSSAVSSGDFARFATQVADDVALAPVGPRVEGRFTYEIATAGAFDTPIIQVVARFVWVYAFEPTGDGLDVHLVVVRDELTWEVRQGRPWTEAAEGLWLPVAAFQVWGARCSVYEDGVLRPEGNSVASLDDELIFDPEGSLNPGKGC